MAVKIARPIDEVVDVPVMDNPLDVVSTEQAGDMVSEEVLQQAMNCEQTVLRIKRQTVISFVEMGKVLKEIRDNSYYKLLGYNDFEEWCESPEIDFSRTTAWRYITLVEKIIESGLYTLEEIEDKSLYKLVAIASHATPEDRLDRLLDLSTNDFKVELARVVESKKSLPDPKAKQIATPNEVQDPFKVNVESGPASNPFGQGVTVEDVDYEEVSSDKEEDEKLEPLSIDDFGLKGLFRLVPVKERPSDEFIDFPDVKIKGTVFVKQAADGKTFMVEF